MVDVARKRATYAEYMAFTEASELEHACIAGEIDVELAVDEVSTDALGASVG